MATPIPVGLAGLQDADWHLEPDDLSEEWDDDAPLVLATTATTTVTVATARPMTFSPVGNEFDPGLD
ncbi:MAG: hypothetical protein GXP62_21195 [Oligoflexia bacterium]|nr:hypothetical protein [Oligoflexia bacterium]